MPVPVAPFASLAVFATAQYSGYQASFDYLPRLFEKCLPRWSSRTISRNNLKGNRHLKYEMASMSMAQCTYLPLEQSRTSYSPVKDGSEISTFVSSWLKSGNIWSNSSTVGFLVYTYSPVRCWRQIPNQTHSLLWSGWWPTVRVLLLGSLNKLRKIK